jgi:hypothetical protein
MNRPRVNETDQDVEQTTGEHYEFEDTQRNPPQLAGHAWKQRGLMVFCTSCPFEHGFLLDDPSLTLTGLDADGFPQFVKHE